MCGIHGKNPFNLPTAKMWTVETGRNGEMDREIEGDREKEIERESGERNKERDTGEREKARRRQWKRERLFCLQNFQYAPKWNSYSIFRSGCAETASSDLG